MSKFKNYRALTTLTSVILSIVIVLLVLPSSRPVYSNNEAQRSTCWNWTWEMKDGRKDEAVLTMYSDKRVTLSKYGLSGKWRSRGTTYWVDWGRGKGKEDVMTLSDNVLTGSNFETNWIRGEKTSCQ